MTIDNIVIEYSVNPKLIEIILTESESGVKYYIKIADKYIKDIPIVGLFGFDFKTFSILHDILLNKNSKFSYTIKENKCFLDCGIDIQDYPIKTEYCSY